MAALMPSSRPSLACAGIGLLVAGVLAAGCGDYFRPAVPEPPTGDPVVLDYSEAEATLGTLSQGLADKATTNGEFAYIGAFADSTNPDTPGFHQIFDPDVVVLWEQAFGRTAPSDWGVPLERNFYAYLIALQGDPFTIEWQPIENRPDPQPGADEVVLNRSYKIEAVSQDGSARSIIAVGLATLTFRPNATGDWVIVRWVDEVDPAYGLVPANPDQITLGARRLESQ
jgi:hypothetical protein